MIKHMRKIFILLLCLLMVFSCVSCGNRSSKTKNDKTNNDNNNNIHDNEPNNNYEERYRGVMSPDKIIDADLRTLRFEWKANLVRWQLIDRLKEFDPKDMTAYSDWLNRTLKDVDQAMEICNKYGIKVIIALMTLPGGRDDKHRTLIFYNQTYNDKLINVWETIASRYKGHPALLGYDLINEPCQIIDPPLPGMDCISTQLKAVEAIRKVDPSARIYIELSAGDEPHCYRTFKPLNIVNVVYEVHMYRPHEFTHQQVSGNFLPVTAYPGMINGVYYDKNKLKEILQPVRDFQVNYSVPIYVGEFSAVRWASGAAQYLKDCIEIFEEYEWDWSYHVYRSWTGWNLEHENGTSNSPIVVSDVRADRMDVVLAGLALNEDNP